MTPNPPLANSASPPPRRRRRTLAVLLTLTILVALAALGWRAWEWLQIREHTIRLAEQQQVDALRSRLDALRRDQRVQSQRLQQADTTNRLLRDELLGLGQRAGLLEDSVHKLADSNRQGAQALRVDEVDLLLSQGLQRLQLAGDLDGAQRAYALAAGVLNTVNDPLWLSVRQTLEQERSALQALGTDPKVVAIGKLDAFNAALSLPATPTAAATAPDAPWWQRAFGRMLQIQRSDAATLLAANDRQTGLAALQLDLALARAAAERRDQAAYQAAVQRAATWLPRLWPDSPQRRQQQQQLHDLGALPLQVQLPTMGSSLQQLRAMRSQS